MAAILAIGPHIFEILPLSLQKISETTKANWPASQRFGRGEDELSIEGLYFDEEWGGHADYLALKATQAAGEPVEVIGWAVAGAASVFGTAVILEVGAEHSHIAASGIGRKVEFTVKLAPFGGDSGGGLF